MLIIGLQLGGAALFVAGTLALRRWLLHNPTPRTAARSGLLSHFMFHLLLFGPLLLGIVNPGLRQFDALVHLPSLPAMSRVAGMMLLGIGVALIVLASGLLGRIGKGAPSFLTPKEFVACGLYARCRNPLALGWYVFCAGIALWASSTYLTLLCLLVLVPAHIFFLKRFEEVELEIRFGASYRDYKARTPFLFPRLAVHP